MEEHCMEERCREEGCMAAGYRPSWSWSYIQCRKEDMGDILRSQGQPELSPRGRGAKVSAS
jgi:hypothetical protein